MTKNEDSLDPKTTSNDDSYVIDIFDIFNSLWRQKFLIASLSIASGILSIILALQLPIIYKTDALLYPADSSSSGLNSQLGGFASLAGIGMEKTAVSQTDLAIAVATSLDFFKRNLYEDIVLEISSEGWDQELNQLIHDPSVYDEESNTWVSDKPTFQQAHGNFMDKVLIKEEPLTGLISISIEHFSPIVSKRWSDLIIKKINAEMRNKEIKEVNLALEHFGRELEKTSIISMQKVFSDLMKDQHTKLMLANVKEDYIFEVVEPAIIPEKRFKPQRARYCVIFTFIATIFSLLFGYVFDKSSRFFK